MNQSSLCGLPKLWPTVLHWWFLIYAKRSLSCNRIFNELKCSGALRFFPACCWCSGMSPKYKTPFTHSNYTNLLLLYSLLSRVMTKSVVFLLCLSSSVHSLFKYLCAEALDYIVPQLTICIVCKITLNFLWLYISTSKDSQDRSTFTFFFLHM